MSQTAWQNGNGNTNSNANAPPSSQNVSELEQIIGVYFRNDNTLENAQELLATLDARNLIGKLLDPREEGQDLLENKVRIRCIIRMLAHAEIAEAVIRPTIDGSFAEMARVEAARTGSGNLMTQNGILMTKWYSNDTEYYFYSEC
jgi:hypothetical protein